jgi:hypothetical protein
MMRRGLLWLLLLLTSGTFALSEAQQLGGRMHQSNMRLNKLRAGTLTNCGTNNFVSGFRADGTPVCATLSLATLTDGSSVVTLAASQKIANKQNVPKAVSYTPAGTPLSITPNLDTTDVVLVDSIPGDLTINAPIGTGGNPTEEQELAFRFKSTTPRALTWHAIYSTENGIPLPSATTGNGTTTDRVKVIFNAGSAKYGSVATTQGSGRGVTTSTGTATTLNCNAQIAALCRHTMTGAAGTLTITMSGTVTDGTLTRISLKCTNAQILTLSTAGFMPSPNVSLTVSCPATAGGMGWFELGFSYSQADGKHQIIATN